MPLSLSDSAALLFQQNIMSCGFCLLRDFMLVLLSVKQRGCCGNQAFSSSTSLWEIPSHVQIHNIWSVSESFKIDSNYLSLSEQTKSLLVFLPHPVQPSATFCFTLVTPTRKGFLKYTFGTKNSFLVNLPQRLVWHTFVIYMQPFQQCLNVFLVEGTLANRLIAMSALKDSLASFSMCAYVAWSYSVVTMSLSPDQLFVKGCHWVHSGSVWE